MTSAHIDVDRLTSWMDRVGLGAGPIENLVRLSGGTQNVLLQYERDGRGFVLRRPPPNPRPESNETMRREARVLHALQDTAVPHPSLIAACGDESVLGVAFYLMEPVAGFTATAVMPPLHAGDPAIRHRMGLAIVEGALTIAQVDVAAAGLGNFGRPDNYLERQVGRWTAQLDGYTKFENWPGREGLPGVDAVAQYLVDNRPATFRPGLMHGDYSLANVMYRYDSGELAAIIDWELATIGDPLIDFGWLLATWPGVPPVELDVLRVEPWDGFPSATELLDHYAARTDRSLAHLDWYVVLASFKLAIILEGSHARACAGHDPVETGDKLHNTARKLLLRALHRIQ